MNNKPKYSLFKNASYAFSGLGHAFRTESSFKLEVFFTIPLLLAIYFFPFALSSKLFLFVTLILIMIVELLNSAVENVVDLVTTDIHPLAKSAKDIGATAVLFTLVLHGAVWCIVLLEQYA